MAVAEGHLVAAAVDSNSRDYFLQKRDGVAQPLADPMAGHQYMTADSPSRVRQGQDSDGREMPGSQDMALLLLVVVVVATLVDMVCVCVGGRGFFCCQGTNYRLHFS